MIGERVLARLPIRRKLSLPVSLAAVVAIAAVVATLLVVEWIDTRRSLVRQLEVRSQILSDSSQAVLAFRDVERGFELLGALRADPNLTAAALLDENGGLVASYLRPDATPPAAWEGDDGTVFEARQLLTRQPVVLDSERVGTIVLQASLDPLFARLRAAFLIALALTLLIVIFMNQLSGVLQRWIADPIVELASTAGQIQDSRDYSLRARRTREDELGLLQDAFNSMLGVIEQRARELERAHQGLEQKVAERTAELSKEIAERRRVERELRAYSLKLQRSNRDLEDFAYVASHDLQEPLRKIQAFSDRLSQSLEGQLDDRSQDYLERMRSAADRMRKLITDILSLSRVSTRGQPMVPIELEDVVEGVIGDLEITIQESAAEIEISGALPTVMADPAQLRQLFQNLLSNSIKFRQPDRVPRIRISPAQEQGEGRVTIEVTDNGIGFEEVHAERIFGVFQRLHGRNQYEGSGIGLAICRRIVERHGGEIAAASEPGVGTTVTITLTRSETAGEAPSEAPPAASQVQFG